MFNYILRRILGAIPLIFGVLTLTFFIIRLAPGDPASFFIQPGVSPKVAEQMREQYGLNDPLPIQYVKWLGNIVQGDFGRSFSRHKPVFEVMIDTIPITLLLAIIGILSQFIFGILMGVTSAVRQGTTLDRSLTISALVIYSMPEFWFALMLIIVFSLQLGWLPASNLNSVGADALEPIDFALDRLKHLAMPIFVLTLGSGASLARFVRGQMLEVIRQDYVRTARAKGLSEQAVIYKHAFRNAMLPVVTILGGSLPALFGGALFIEVIFAIPGMGRVIIEAVFARDYPLIIANTFVSGTLIVLGNLIADVLYAVVDPRIKLS